MTAGRRVEMGFEGGTILRLTIQEQAAQELVAGLGNGDGKWSSVEAEEGTHWLNTGELVYIRLVPGEPSRVGFGGS